MLAGAGLSDAISAAGRTGAFTRHVLEIIRVGAEAGNGCLRAPLSPLYQRGDDTAHLAARCCPPRPRLPLASHSAVFTPHTGHACNALDSQE
jgi:hypothetical protein